MYIYDRKWSGLQSLVKQQPITSGPVQRNAYYLDRVVDGFLGRGGTNDSFSPACDSSVATPGFSAAERGKLTRLLSPSQSTQAIRWNRERHPAQSGARLEDVVIDLARYVDFAAVRAAIQKSGGSYTIREGTIDAVFVEAVHQFQAKVYFHADEQSGALGPSTLDSLGIVQHKVKPKIGNVHGRDVVKNISDKISTLTNNEFNAKNWFDLIVAPSFLGHRINRHSQGIHLLLLRKLREAENHLLSLPAYAGMTPVALGRALGLDRKSVYYSGGRLSQENQAMHGVGLALDIDVAGNPWIGAGWIKDDKAGRDWLIDQIKTNPDAQLKRKYQGILNKRNERYRFLETLKSAARGSLNGAVKGTIASFLHALAVSHGRDTRGAYGILTRRNEEFKTFLQNNSSELRYWKNSATFGDRDPLNGFLNLHTDLVFALRQTVLLAWGAIDFGSSASGDVMHFDLRTLGAGRVIAEKLGAYIPRSGHHPANGGTD
jgi:hypothetical protein